MKELANIARNVSYLKDKEGAYRPFVELILVVSEPEYKTTNTGDMVRERKSETLRVGMLASGVHHLRDYLDELITELAVDDAEVDEPPVMDER